ncbi:MAG: hypothetical protein J7M17_00245, partial [Anaerolineae bacterium]|nr:hypothetical protein [Anaerolineae bacterium]
NNACPKLDIVKLRTDCTDFLFFSREFAPFAVDFGSTMRNPKEPASFCSKERLCWLFQLQLGIEERG